MATIAYERERTALLVVDPYNDFISEGGKIWDRIRAVAEANKCVPHMLQVLNAAREAKLRGFLRDVGHSQPYLIRRGKAIFLHRESTLIKSAGYAVQTSSA